MAVIATILTYHDVRAPEQSRWPRRYASPALLSPGQFGRQLDSLVQSARPVVTVGAVLSALAGGPALPKGAISLTFDEGLADHHDVVMPMLLARGLVGSFFVPVLPITQGRVIDTHKLQFVVAAADSQQDVVAAVFDLVAEHRRAGAALPAGPSAWEGIERLSGSSASSEMVFINRLLRSGLPSGVRQSVIDQLFKTFVTADEADFAADLYLTMDKVKSLANGGMELGGHGYCPTNLQGLPRSAQVREVASSARFLKELAPSARPILAYAYPNGGWDEISLELLPGQGFAGGLTVHPGKVDKTSDPLRLPRCDAALHFSEAVGRHT